MTIDGFFPTFAGYIPDLPISVIPAEAAVVIDGSAVIHRLITRHSLSIMQSDDVTEFYRDLVAELRRWKNAPCGSEEAIVTFERAHGIVSLDLSEPTK
jgi:hypothetical protein